MRALPKIIVIVGPTASGKTDLGLWLAKKYNGEVVSADSRQVYMQMDVGTAKPKGVWHDGVYMVDGVVHHMVNIVKPDEDFSLARFKEMATICIQDILRRKKLPIIVGGTGLYIWTIVDNLDIPSVQPNLELRAELEQKQLSELVQLLQEKDPETAKKIDIKNPRRVLRAVEVVLSSGKSFIAQQTKSDPLYDVLQIGINLPVDELYSRIDQRVEMQMQDGLLAETQCLVQAGYGWDLPSMSGIGYRQMGYFLRGEMDLVQAIQVLKSDTKKYAKRQMTWFRRDKRIYWISENLNTKAERLVQDFLWNTSD